jgi:hypothetical protein
MGNSPNKLWGSGENDVPSTEINDHQILRIPYISDNIKAFKKSKTIEMFSPDNAEIYYTLDESEPSEKSIKYEKPLVIEKTVKLKMIAIDKNKNKSFIVNSEFFMIPEGRSVTLKNLYSKLYTAGGPDALIDFVRGTANFRLGNWQGYGGCDFEAVVDLGKVEHIKKAGAGFLQDVKSWIWFPKEVEIFFSEDGINFISAGVINNNIPDNDYNVQVKDFVKEVNVKARYIKITAKTYGTIPDWHPGAGGKSWIFVDEIITE